MRQFHLEVIAGRAERSPEYSLGSYVRTAVVRERGDLYNQSARIVKVRTASPLLSSLPSPDMPSSSFLSLIDTTTLLHYIFYIHVRVTLSIIFSCYIHVTPPLDFPSCTPCSLQLVDYFSGGQHCDETQGTRGSEVHIQCCYGLHVNSPNENIVNRLDNVETGSGEGQDAFEVRTETRFFSGTTLTPLILQTLSRLIVTKYRVNT